MQSQERDWEIIRSLQRIENGVDAMKEQLSKRSPLESDLLWKIAAAAAVVLLLPESKQQAILGLIFK
jgi:hypothetical protein